MGATGNDHIKQTKPVLERQICFVSLVGPEIYIATLNDIRICDRAEVVISRRTKGSDWTGS